jgi:hypothetical protein
VPPVLLIAVNGLVEFLYWQSAALEVVSVTVKEDWTYVPVGDWSWTAKEHSVEFAYILFVSVWLQQVTAPWMTSFPVAGLVQPR